jgi:hypothetical protein
MACGWNASKSSEEVAFDAAVRASWPLHADTPLLWSTGWENAWAPVVEGCTVAPRDDEYAPNPSRPEQSVGEPFDKE